MPKAFHRYVPNNLLIMSFTPHRYDIATPLHVRLALGSRQDALIDGLGIKIVAKHHVHGMVKFFLMDQISLDEDLVPHRSVLAQEVARLVVPIPARFEHTLEPDEQRSLRHGRKEDGASEEDLSSGLGEGRTRTSPKARHSSW